MVRPGRPTSGDATKNGILIGVAGGDPVYLTIDELGPMTIEEVDGSPTVGATKLVLPNGTLGVVGTVATYTPAAASLTGTVFPIYFAISGGGSAITGNPEFAIVIPAAGTIVSATMLADQSGSAVVDIWKDTFANYPPTVADTITASAKPTLSSAISSQDTTLTGWTTSLAAGDVLKFHLDSSATITWLSLTLLYTRA